MVFFLSLIVFKVLVLVDFAFDREMCGEIALAAGRFCGFTWMHIEEQVTTHMVG